MYEWIDLFVNLQTVINRNMKWELEVNSSQWLTLVCLFYLSAATFNIRHEEVKEKDGHEGGRKELPRVCFAVCSAYTVYFTVCLTCPNTAPSSPLPPPQSSMPRLLGFQWVSLVGLEPASSDGSRIINLRRQLFFFPSFPPFLHTGWVGWGRYEGVL